MSDADFKYEDIDDAVRRLSRQIDDAQSELDGMVASACQELDEDIPADGTPRDPLLILGSIDERRIRLNAMRRVHALLQETLVARSLSRARRQMAALEYEARGESRTILRDLRDRQYEQALRHGHDIRSNREELALLKEIIG